VEAAPEPSKPRAVDASAITQSSAADLQAALGRSAFVDPDEKVLVATHVTGDKAKAISVLLSGKDLTKTYGDDRSAELGPGFYVSDIPQIWETRATSKWDFLNKLDDVQRAEIGRKLDKELTHHRFTHYISESELKQAQRQRKKFEDGSDVEGAVMLAGQPYNIQWWKPDWLTPLGIGGGTQPVHMEVRFRGKFIDLTDAQYPKPEQVAEYRKDGYDGAYVRQGMGTTAQLVIWNRDAIQAVNGKALSLMKPEQSSQPAASKAAFNQKKADAKPDLSQHDKGEHESTLPLGTEVRIRKKNKSFVAFKVGKNGRHSDQWNVYVVGASGNKSLIYSEGWKFVKEWAVQDPADEPRNDLKLKSDAQPVLPGAESVREQNVATPEFELPFSLAPKKGAKAKQKPQPGVFDKQARALPTLPLSQLARGRYSNAETRGVV